MIEIYKNPNCDTRTANKNVTFEEFQEANDNHIYDVQNVMYKIAILIQKTGKLHDCIKKCQEKMFFRDFKSALENNDDFSESEFYKLHSTAERHHLAANCPDDVNLIDVLEMIVDCSCATLARCGETKRITLDSDVLLRAVDNTYNLIESMIELVDESDI